MKKLINNPLNIVREALEATVDMAPGLALLADENVVVRTGLGEFDSRPVAILSGGGSGHEPGHAGFVGQAMLSGAIAGDIFTSPSVDAVLAAIRAVGGAKGALLIVKNYTGDRINFGLAAELATAEGIPTKMVLVGDDVALRDTVTIERRRGIAGTIFVHKIAGAAAASGASLDEVVAAATRAAQAVGTMGVSLGACTVPSVGKPGFVLGADEIELGLGIHGEQGVERMKLAPVDQLVERIIDTILLDRGFAAGQRVAILVNGLGATPPIELTLVARRALSYAREKGLVVERLYSGVYLSALDMPGCSISLLPVDEADLAALDCDTDAAGWTSKGRVAAQRAIIASTRAPEPQAEVIEGPQSAILRKIAAAIAAELVAAEDKLADLDSKTGDGDLGASMVRGARAIQKLPASAYNSPASFLTLLGAALRRDIAGSSGPFYAVGLARAARLLADTDAPSAAEWHAAFAGAVEAICDLGGAKLGDRTMVDALAPASDAVAAAIAAGATGAQIAAAFAAATQSGADHSATLLPKLGRAAYLGERALGHPDAGASAVAVWAAALSTALNS